MMKTLHVKHIGLLPDVELNEIPAILSSEEVEYHPIACDNWNWSVRNPSVRFATAHTGDSLLLHFHVRDNELRAVETDDEGRVWEDSCCEFFLSPECGERYYNIECNCIGSLVFHYGTADDRAWAPENCFRLIRRWSSLGQDAIEKHRVDIEWDLIEIIPASALFADRIESFSGLRMTANFYKCGDLLDAPHFLSWSPIALPKPMFHCPEFFGTLFFE